MSGRRGLTDEENHTDSLEVRRLSDRENNRSHIFDSNGNRIRIGDISGARTAAPATRRRRLRGCEATMGHDVKALRVPGTAELIRRGTAWAAGILK